MKQDWSKIDRQMSQFEVDLLALKISKEECNRLATSLYKDVLQLPEEIKQSIYDAPISIRDRLDELQSYQAFNDGFSGWLPKQPHEIRAQVVVQNYICFVYLGEAVFLKLARGSPPASTLRRCSECLTNNPVRAFRNAIAHANWRYKSDFSGLQFWAKKGNTKEEPMIEWEVSQHTLNFWQALARTVGYIAYSALSNTQELGLS
jgi:hypothetical protein